MANQVVSLNTAVSPYEADLAQIGQRQKLADMLQQQALQPPERFSYNGIEAHTPSTAYLAKMLQGVTAVYGQKKTIDDQRALSAKAQSDASDWITKLTSGVPATPEVPGSVPATPADVNDREQGMAMGTGAQPMTPGQAIPVPGGMGEGPNVGSPPVAGHAPTDPERLALLMQGSANPVTSSFAGPMLMQEMSRQRLLAALGVGSPQAGSPAGAAPAGAMPGGAPAAPGATPGAPGAVPGVQSRTSIGGPAGGIPMAVWLATDPTGKAYMEQLAKDNAPISTRYGIFSRDPSNPNQFSPVGGAMPANALPYRTGPDGKPDVSPYPGQVAGAAAMAGATAGAQAGAKFPYETVETPSGAKVPAFTVPGLVPGANPGAQPQAPSGAAPAAVPATAGPAPAPTATPPATPTGAAPVAPVVPKVGQGTAARAYNEDAGKTAVEYENNVNTSASQAVGQNRMLDELTNSLKDMDPGKLAAVQKSIAEWKVATGLGDDNDRKIAASSEVTDKLTGQLVSSALKSMTARPTQAEFQIFLNKFVPNMNMTPQGANAVIGFMRQQNNLNLQKQQAFQEWKKNVPPQNYRDFEPIWNQQVAKAPLTNGDSFGTSNPAQGSVIEGATATNPQTGAKIIFKGGQWQPAQ